MADEESSSSSPPASKTRLKFLCSCGGKILPRPSDGQLKYVGGDTRVVSAPRPLSFSELREKIGAVFPGESVVRYQLLGEDLDALVTVKSDEDVQHMLDEYDRQVAARSNSTSPTFAGGVAGTASPRFRLFLFPADPTYGDSPPHRQSLLRCGSVEERYIDAINGGCGGAPRRLSGVGGGGSAGGKTIFTISSGGSSPTSTAPTVYPVVPTPVSSLDFISGGLRRTKPMHKAHSSPNLMQLGATPPVVYPNPQPHQPHYYHYPLTSYKQPIHNRSSIHLSSYHSNHYPHPHSHPHLHLGQSHNLPHPHANLSHHGGARTTGISPAGGDPLWPMNSGSAVNSGTTGGGARSPQHLNRRQHYGAGSLSHTTTGFGPGLGPLRGGPPPWAFGGHVDDGTCSSRPRSHEEHYPWEQ